MAKGAEPSRPNEAVRVRKIANGYMISRAGLTPRGKVYLREEFSAEKPGSKPVVIAAKGKASNREVGFLNGAAKR